MNMLRTADVDKFPLESQYWLLLRSYNYVGHHACTLLDWPESLYTLYTWADHVGNHKILLTTIKFITVVESSSDSIVEWDMLNL